MTHVTRDVRRDRGSVLIMAVIAMLILAVLGVSFALLSRIETEIGFNYKQQAQAEALAEAGLDRARDELRSAATLPGGFGTWLNTMLWGGAAQQPAVYAGNAAYGYLARVDNDCAALNTVPASIEEPVTCADASIRNTTDTNETAVVTAWAQAGSGRSRVRAILSVDNAWKHVCSDHKADNGGLCNNDDNTNGNPSIQPADPNDPNGPASWDDLPRPYMGCSRIDPTLHGGASNVAACAAYPAMYTYPSYPAGVGVPRLVVMGPDPAVVTGAKRCFPDPANPGVGYFGYFDCALVTPCNPAVTNCGPSGTIRKGCLPASHPSGFDPSLFVKLDPVPIVPGVNDCVTKGGNGMVFRTQDLPNGNWGGTAGGSTTITRFTIYVLNPWKVDIGTPGDHTVVGTVVVEGNGQPGAGSTNFCGGSNADAIAGTRSKFYTGPTPATNPLAGTWGPEQYGYPLAFLIWDPLQVAETPSLPTSAGAPQRTCGDMGSAGGGPSDRAQIHGLVYSGGHVEFNPMSLDGGVIAWEIQTQASSSNYAYNYSYGAATPPPGFPKGGGTEVKVVRKSFIVCSNYNDDSTSATACQ